MLKSRPVGKPAKLAGSGRKLIRAFPQFAPLEDNELMKASKEIYLGLAVFHATFGYDNDNQETPFHGFSPHEVKFARDKSAIRRNQVEKEYKSRGFLFTPFGPSRSPLLPVSSSKALNKTMSKLHTHIQTQTSQVKKEPSEVVPFKINKNVFQKRRTKCTGIDNSGSALSEVNHRAIAKKFVLPIRSAHSSRVIKPNKRFRDIDDDATNSDSSDVRLAKKKRQSYDTSSEVSGSSHLEKRTEGSVASDLESNWSSSVSSTSSIGDDEDYSPEDYNPAEDYNPPAQGKVILRKAKLKVEPNPPAPAGPFSSVVGDSGVPQKIVCGVCGAVRYYKHLKQARKFGTYSCESCRKFISKMILFETNNGSGHLQCKDGKGKCTIAQYLSGPLGPAKGERESRCWACWLTMCLRCYSMPESLKTRLVRLLSSPDDDNNQTKPKTGTKYQRKNKRSNTSVLASRIGNRVVEKQLIIAKNLKRKAEEIARKDMKRKTISNPTITQRKVLKATKKMEAKCKLTVSEITMQKKRGRRKGEPVKLGIQGKGIKKEKNKDSKLVRLHKLSLKGPRVKHVCRSASLVLGQPVATFTDTSPSKQKVATARDCDAENVLSLLPGQSEESANNSKIFDQGPRIRQPSDDCDLSTKNKSTYKHSDVSESTEEGLLEGKARTLQDLTRQYYELINGATFEDNRGLISIDFWESYDPEEVCKNGFALIGIGESFNTNSICFICGSAGLDKLIHCACCCEPYHHYCVDSSGQLLAAAMVEGADWWMVDWVCARCSLCHTCGKSGGSQVACQKCRKTHHTDCLAADRQASRLHSADRPWICLACLCCKSCNAAEVYKFVGNLPLCRVCFKLRQKGNFCPLCQRCYDENDFDTKMMECERCKCWVHAKCEGLSDEKYQILSILPDSVEFVCRKCCKMPPAPWWLAVEAELKAGFLAVLKSLSKNRKVCDLLKWSPTKRPTQVCTCTGSGLRQRVAGFPELCEQSDAESADMRALSDCQRDETMVSEEECLKTFQTYSTESDENQSCDIKSEMSEKQTLVCDVRTKENVQDCSLLVKSDDLHLRLDSDTISYQNVEEKPSQFSPHATSQSDSGIGSTDDELKSTNDQCFCIGLEKWSKAPPTLMTIKKKVNSNEYLSLDGFNKEMEEMINNILGTELLKLYYQILEDTFPWFNPKCPDSFESSSRVNHYIDSTISIKSLPEEKNGEVGIEDVSVTLKGKLNLDMDYYYNFEKPLDVRICILCKKDGEGKTTEEGRLLYCGQNDWVHTNCALWSNEVFEEIDGSLQNVQSAISRSRHIRCAKCNMKGASIGCCNRSCPEAYHFSCARGGGCVFFEDKSLFCNSHKFDNTSSRILDTGPDFLVSRPAYVELERKKKKNVTKHNVRIMIGSLTITSLGDFVSDLSDQGCSIIPCNFQCTRMFWSSVEPWRLVEYNIRTKIVYTDTDPILKNDKNFTISHSVDELKTNEGNGLQTSVEKLSPIECPTSVISDEIKEIMEYLLDFVCSKDDDDNQASTDLLPPELKEAIFEDLPHDLLDGISMQDIFPRLMNFDNPMSDVKSEKEHKIPSVSDSNDLNRKTENLKDNDKNATLSQNNESITNTDLKPREKLQLSSSKKRKMNVQHDEFQSNIKHEEKENVNKWSSPKILQIDGSGDCSSESSDSSPVNDESSTPVLQGHVQCLSVTELNTTQSEEIMNNSKLDEINSLNKTTPKKVLQFDGTGDCVNMNSDFISSVTEELCSPMLRVRLERLSDEQINQIQNIQVRIKDQENKEDQSEIKETNQSQNETLVSNVKHVETEIAIKEINKNEKEEEKLDMEDEEEKTTIEDVNSIQMNEVPYTVKHEENNDSNKVFIEIKELKNYSNNITEVVNNQLGEILKEKLERSNKQKTEVNVNNNSNLRQEEKVENNVHSLIENSKNEFIPIENKVLDIVINDYKISSNNNSSQKMLKQVDKDLCNNEEFDQIKNEIVTRHNTNKKEVHVDKNLNKSQHQLISNVHTVEDKLIKKSTKTNNKGLFCNIASNNKNFAEQEVAQKVLEKIDMKIFNNKPEETKKERKLTRHSKHKEATVNMHSNESQDKVLHNIESVKDNSIKQATKIKKEDICDKVVKNNKAIVITECSQKILQKVDVELCTEQFEEIQKEKKVTRHSKHIADGYANKHSNKCQDKEISNIHPVKGHSIKQSAKSKNNEALDNISKNNKEVSEILEKVYLELCNNEQFEEIQNEKKVTWHSKHVGDANDKHSTKCQDEEISNILPLKGNSVKQSTKMKNNEVPDNISKTNKKVSGKKGSQKIFEKVYVEQCTEQFEEIHVEKVTQHSKHIEEANSMHSTKIKGEELSNIRPVKGNSIKQSTKIKNNAVLDDVSKNIKEVVDKKYSQKILKNVDIALCSNKKFKETQKEEKVKRHTKLMEQASVYNHHPVKDNSIKQSTKIKKEYVLDNATNNDKEIPDKKCSQNILGKYSLARCNNGRSNLISDYKDLWTPRLEVRVERLTDEQIIDYQTHRKACILQLDGVADSCCSSCSSSECGSPRRESVWKLGQLDGAMDLCFGRDDDLEENPVKCSRCHRTYRTALSFERHLQTCNADYILSCSESDSSEEEKTNNSDITPIDNITLNGDEIDKVQDETKEIPLELNEHYMNGQVQEYPTEKSIIKSSQVRTYIIKGSSRKVVKSCEENHVSHYQPIDRTNNQFELVTLNNEASRVLTVEPHHVYPSKPKTMRAMVGSPDSRLPHALMSGRKSPVIIRPVKTYARLKKSIMPASTLTETTQPEQTMDYHNSQSLVLQQVPSHNMIPSYVESIPPPATANNVQYQYITAINVQDKPQIPLTIQIQPQISIQPVMPTVLGTLIQPNGVEQFLVNAPTQAVDILNQQPTNVYITNVNQPPVYVGMETVVSNTMMSSSQFVSGMMTNSSYSATTTQVYQPPKPVMDLPQRYVVVNTHTPTHETLPQTYQPQQQPQPWAYNYQQTYKVKEKTTYQQVYRHIIQDQSNLDYVKQGNSAKDAFIAQKPLVKEVTVEKTHKICKSGPVANLESMVKNANPLFLNKTLKETSRDKQFVKSNTNITTNNVATNWAMDIKQKTIQSSPLQEQTSPQKRLVSIKKYSSHANANQISLENNMSQMLQNKQHEITTSQSQHVNIVKHIKPVITKVKSDSSIKTCSFSVNLNKHDVDSKVLEIQRCVPTDVPVITKEGSISPVKSDSGELISRDTKFRVQSEGKVIKHGLDNKIENNKSSVEKRTPLKENKVVTIRRVNNNNITKNMISENNLLNPKLMYEISSQDGLSVCSQDLSEAWKTIFEAVQSARAAKRLPPLPHNPLASHLKMLGLDNNSVKYLIEQLPGVGSCTKYKPVYHKSKLFGHSDPLRENPTGCARSEAYSNNRKKYDIFSWLASRHRQPPKLLVNTDTEIVNGISRRATSLNLPMAMRFRHLRETSKEAVGVFRSDIHGRGLFCLRDIDAGEMVIEYAGEVIRAGLTDKREHYYTSKGIGCYMFRIDDHFVVDATMHGNAARFINHSCEPNCYSRVVDILGKKHILIFALRKILQGEELTYDYKFPLEEDKITCHCLSRKCRKYLN